MSFVLILSQILSSATAQALDFNTSVKNAETAQQNLSSCSIGKDDQRNILSEVSMGMISDVEKTENTCTGTQDSFQKFKTDILQIEKHLQKNLVVMGSRGITHEQAVGFSKDLRFQSVKNSLMTYLDAETRYDLDAPKAQGLLKIKTAATAFCTDPSGNNTCDPDEMDQLQALVSDYRAAMGKAGIKPMTPTQASVILGDKIQKLNHMLIDPIYGAESESIVDWDAEKPSIGIRTVPHQFYTALEKEASRGAGLLLYTDAISKNKTKEGFISSGPGLPPNLATEVIKAVTEIKQKSLDAAHDTNENFENYHHHDDHGFNDLKKMMLANPVAVGQILVDHPDYSLLVCKIAQMIEAEDQGKRTLGKLVQGTAWGGMIVGGAMILTGFFAGPGEAVEGGSEGLSLAATRGFLQTAATGIALSRASLQTAYTYFIVHPDLNSEIKNNQQGLLTQNGGSVLKIRAAEKEYSEADWALGRTLAMNLIPVATRQTVQFLHASDVFAKDANIMNALMKVWVLSESDQTVRTLFSAIDLACSVMSANGCRYLLSTFNHLTPQERLKLSQKESLDAFVAKVQANEKNPEFINDLVPKNAPVH